MNLTISGHHLDVTPALREYVLAKLDRITRHFDQVVDITVLLSVEKPSEKERRQKAEVTLHVKGKDIFVESASRRPLRGDRPADGQARPPGRAATRTGSRTTTTARAKRHRRHAELTRDRRPRAACGRLFRGACRPGAAVAAAPQRGESAPLTPGHSTARADLHNSSIRHFCDGRPAQPPNVAVAVR